MSVNIFQHLHLQENQTFVIVNGYADDSVIYIKVVRQVTSAKQTTAKCQDKTRNNAFKAFK